VTLARGAPPDRKTLSQENFPGGARTNFLTLTAIVQKYLYCCFMTILAFPLYTSRQLSSSCVACSSQHSSTYVNSIRPQASANHTPYIDLLKHQSQFRPVLGCRTTKRQSSACSQQRTVRSSPVGNLSTQNLSCRLPFFLQVCLSVRLQSMQEELQISQLG